MVYGVIVCWPKIGIQGSAVRLTRKLTGFAITGKIINAPSEALDCLTFFHLICLMKSAYHLQ